MVAAAILRDKHGGQLVVPPDCLYMQVSIAVHLLCNNIHMWMWYKCMQNKQFTQKEIVY